MDVFLSCSKRPCLLDEENKKNKTLSPQFLFIMMHLVISMKIWICISVAESLLPHAPFFLKPFPCLSQLSRPSAVCFLLTFSSCAQTLPEVLLTEPGLWEWAGSQHWPEISSSNWISRRGGAITHAQR